MLGHCDWLQDSGAQWGWEGLAGGPMLLDARSRRVCQNRVWTHPHLGGGVRGPLERKP